MGFVPELHDYVWMQEGAYERIRDSVTEEYVYGMVYHQIYAPGAMLMARGLNPAYDSIFIRGTVLRAIDLTPFIYARVRLYHDDEFVAETLTNSAGAYTFFNIPHGTNYRVTIHARWYQPAIINSFSTEAGTFVGSVIDTVLPTQLLRQSAYVVWTWFLRWTIPEA